MLERKKLSTNFFFPKISYREYIYIYSVTLTSYKSADSFRDNFIVFISDKTENKTVARLI